MPGNPSGRIGCLATTLWYVHHMPNTTTAAAPEFWIESDRPDRGPFPTWDDARAVQFDLRLIGSSIVER